MCLQIITIYWVILQLFILFFRCITYPPRKIIQLFIKQSKFLLHKLFSIALKHHTPYQQKLLHPKGFLNPTANQCFANALLQCLYHLPLFKNQILQKSLLQNKIPRHLFLLFQAMQSPCTSYNEIHNHKENLFKTLARYSPEIPLFTKTGGDSRLFFISLMSSLRDSDLIYHLFCEAQIVKKIECIPCQRVMKVKPLEIKEDSLLINIEESLYYRSAGIANFFQYKTQKRHCKVHGERTDHEVTISIDKLPQILALRMAENPAEDLPAENFKPHLTLFINNKNLESKKYIFMAGVFNTKRGYEGHHSVAYIRNQDNFLCYNDQYVSSLKGEKIRGYAKILFYCQEVTS